MKKIILTGSILIIFLTILNFEKILIFGLEFVISLRVGLEYEQQIEWAREEYLTTGFGGFYSDVYNFSTWVGENEKFDSSLCYFGNDLYDKLTDKEKRKYIYRNSFCPSDYQKGKVLGRIHSLKDENIFEVNIDSLFGKEARSIILEEYQMSDYKTKEPCNKDKCFMYIDKNGFIGRNKDSNFMDNFIKDENR